MQSNQYVSSIMLCSLVLCGRFKSTLDFAIVRLGGRKHSLFDEFFNSNAWLIHQVFFQLDVKCTLLEVHVVKYHTTVNVASLHRFSHKDALPAWCKAPRPDNKVRIEWNIHWIICTGRNGAKVHGSCQQCTGVMSTNTPINIIRQADSVTEVSSGSLRTYL